MHEIRHNLGHGGQNKSSRMHEGMRNREARFCKDFPSKKEYIQVNDDLLSYAVLDYFTDTERLKEFHNIEKIQP